MPRYKKQKQDRYDWLITSGLERFEAVEFVDLPRRTPALRKIIADRQAKRKRFEHYAATMIDKGAWAPWQLGEKWKGSIKKMYRARRWVVQHGPSHSMPGAKKGDPNPWSMYRASEKHVPDKGYVSPWQTKQVATGANKLVKGLIFVQSLERRRAKGQVSDSTVRQWITEKEMAINSARGEQKTALILQRNRLERMLR